MIKNILILIITLLLFSCNEKEEIPEVDIYFGSGSAQLNGEMWEGKVRSSYTYSSYDSINLSIERYEGDFKRSTMHISKIYFGVGKTILNRRVVGIKCLQNCTSFSTTLDHGDVAGDLYDPLISDNFDDWIFIDSINEETLEFWGRFQGSFSRDPSHEKYDVFPDTLYIADGVFNGKVIEREK